uniref:Nicotinamide riboside kinase 1 n=1 Tax=Lygus hesperus TaxID=30085 RepID=A0A0K8TE61_LYGHE
MPWFVLGLCGVTNSGKTTTASKLTEYYPNSVHIKQDDYFLAEDDPSCATCFMLFQICRHVIIRGLNHQNWELITSVDMDKMIEDIKRTLAMDPPELRLLILDGFLLFADPRTASACHLKIYLELDYETCRARRNQRTYDPPDVPGYFDQVVWPEAESAKNYMLSKNSDIVVLDGKLPEHVILDILKKIIKR